MYRMISMIRWPMDLTKHTQQQQQQHKQHNKNDAHLHSPSLTATVLLQHQRHIPPSSSPSIGGRSSPPLLAAGLPSSGSSNTSFSPPRTSIGGSPGISSSRSPKDALTVPRDLTESRTVHGCGLTPDSLIASTGRTMKYSMVHASPTTSTMHTWFSSRKVNKMAINTELHGCRNPLGRFRCLMQLRRSSPRL